MGLKSKILKFFLDIVSTLSTRRGEDNFRRFCFNSSLSDGNYHSFSFDVFFGVFFQFDFFVFCNIKVSLFINSL